MLGYWRRRSLGAILGAAVAPLAVIAGALAVGVGGGGLGGLGELSQVVDGPKAPARSTGPAIREQARGARLLTRLAPARAAGEAAADRTATRAPATATEPVPAPPTQPAPVSPNGPGASAPELPAPSVPATPPAPSTPAPAAPAPAPTSAPAPRPTATPTPRPSLVDQLGEQVTTITDPVPVVGPVVGQVVDDVSGVADGLLSPR